MTFRLIGFILEKDYDHGGGGLIKNIIGACEMRRCQGRYYGRGVIVFEERVREKFEILREIWNICAVFCFMRVGRRGVCHYGRW